MYYGLYIICIIYIYMFVCINANVKLSKLMVLLWKGSLTSIFTKWQTYNNWKVKNEFYSIVITFKKCKICSLMYYNLKWLFLLIVTYKLPFIADAPKIIQNFSFSSELLFWVGKIAHAWEGLEGQTIHRSKAIDHIKREI